MSFLALVELSVKESPDYLLFGHTRSFTCIAVYALHAFGVFSVTGQNGSGQNGTDKMVWTKWYTDKMVTGQNGIGQNGTDKMVQTKWHGQNGSNFYRFQFN